MSDRTWHIDYEVGVTVEAPDKDTAWRIAGELLREAAQSSPRIHADTRTYRPSHIHETLESRRRNG